jgi:hypothetical protein
MTDYDDVSKRNQNKILNLQDIKTAIIDADYERLKALLCNEVFDELQKSYLIKLATDNGHPEIAKLLRDTPATP